MSLEAAAKIKLIIWDLDDTLWAGTLAENDTVRLYEHRAAAIRTLNNRGVISAICSKNDPEQARAHLSALGLWDEFVFPRIAFTPKAAILRDMIADMQLRPANVLFIDDNTHNLQEAKFLLPDIHVANAASPEADQWLEAIFEATKTVNKSRVAEYRMLENKLADRQQQTGSNEEFLKTCDIHLTMVHRMDNLPFTVRIEELINRSNQLNYTQSRVADGTMADFVMHVVDHDCYSIFVWDKYGHYGLVGFAAVVKETRLLHLVFSCRIMHMGIEQWVLFRLQELHPRLELPAFAVTPCKAGWITEEKFHDPAISTYLLSKETAKSAVTPILRVMANCQSGGIAHFSGLADEAIFDNMPAGHNPRFASERLFTLRQFMDDAYEAETFPPLLVYGAFVDYGSGYWPGIATADLEAHVYRTCAVRFCEFIARTHRRLLVILAPAAAEEAQYQPHFDATRDRVILFNALWRDLANAYPEIELLDIDAIAGPGDLVNIRHFSPPLLKKIADHTGRWAARMRPAQTIEEGRDGQRI